MRLKNISRSLRVQKIAVITITAIFLSSCGENQTKSDKDRDKTDTVTVGDPSDGPASEPDNDKKYSEILLKGVYFVGDTSYIEISLASNENEQYSALAKDLINDAASGVVEVYLVDSKTNELKKSSYDQAKTNLIVASNDNTIEFEPKDIRDIAYEIRDGEELIAPFIHGRFVPGNYNQTIFYVKKSDFEDLYGPLNIQKEEGEIEEGLSS